ncbi:MAG: hypothetical protein E6Y55_10980, partial [Klebsiella michiganensis]|nr:hypothetical protein [Klebsiella michiganensis]
NDLFINSPLINSPDVFIPEHEKVLQNMCRRKFLTATDECVFTVGSVFDFRIEPDSPRGCVSHSQGGMEFARVPVLSV